MADLVASRSTLVSTVFGEATSAEKDAVEICPPVLKEEGKKIDEEGDPWAIFLILMNLVSFRRDFPLKGGAQAQGRRLHRTDHCSAAAGPGRVHWTQIFSGIVTDFSKILVTKVFSGLL